MDKTEYVVGVTGHRDIHPDTLDTVREQVRATFDQIQRLLPNTSIRLVSGMADGADRMVAEGIVRVIRLRQLSRPLVPSV